MKLSHLTSQQYSNASPSSPPLPMAHFMSSGKPGPGVAIFPPHSSLYCKPAAFPSSPSFWGAQGPPSFQVRQTPAPLVNQAQGCCTPHQTGTVLHCTDFEGLRSINSLSTDAEPAWDFEEGRSLYSQAPKLCNSAHSGCAAPPKAQEQQCAPLRSQVWRHHPKAHMSRRGTGRGGTLSLSAKMAAALTLNYVLRSQPCPQHPTAGNHGGREGRGKFGFPFTPSPKGKGHPCPKATNAILGIDLKHCPTAGHPSSCAKPQRPPLQGLGAVFLAFLQPEVLPLPPGTAVGVGNHSPLLRDVQGTSRSCLLGWDPQGVATHPQGWSPCSATAPGADPDLLLSDTETSNPPGDKKQLPSAFREGINPTLWSFPTLLAPLCSGNPTVPYSTHRREIQ